MERVGIFKDWPNLDEQVSDACPNCHNRTALRLTAQRLIWPQRSDDPRALPREGRKSLTEHLWTCTYCGRNAVVWKFFDAADDLVRNPVEVRLAWPERLPRELPAEAPEAVRSLYREASIVEHAGALRGAAVLYRAAAEELVKDQGAAGGDLYHRIEALRGSGVDEDLVRDLHEARLLGNWSIHEGVTFSAEESADVAELLQDCVEVLYVEPARREAMRTAREARRQGQAPTAGSNGT